MTTALKIYRDYLIRRYTRRDAIRHVLSPHVRTPEEIAGRFLRDPAGLLKLAGITPDPWQEETLATDAKQIALLCSRQAGKTEVAVELSLKTMLAKPRETVLVFAPSERQAAEFVGRVRNLYETLSTPPGSSIRATTRRVLGFYEKLCAEAGKDDYFEQLPDDERLGKLRLQLANGSRLVGLPPKGSTVRGFDAVGLIVIDEAAQVPDELYRTVRPMLAVSGGRLIAMTTPFGKRGWFYEEWVSKRNWFRKEVTARQCPRISAQFLAEELATLGDRWFRQEYLCSFEDAEGQVFQQALIDAALAAGDGLVPLF
jgi:hypothetical protein